MAAKIIIFSFLRNIFFIKILNNEMFINNQRNKAKNNEKKKIPKLLEILRNIVFLPRISKRNSVTEGEKEKAIPCGGSVTIHPM